MAAAPPAAATRTAATYVMTEEGFIEALPYPQSETGDVDHRLGEGLRRLLRQVVADSFRDQAMLVLAREALGIGRRLRMGRAVGVALHGDRRHDDRGKGREFLLQSVVSCFTL